MFQVTASAVKCCFVLYLGVSDAAQIYFFKKSIGSSEYRTNVVTGCHLRQ
jgi:hypothetical protein